jgi:hypothetical protein
MGQPHHAKEGRAQKKVRKTDRKKRPLNRPVPKKDPKLADYYLNRQTSPHPEKTTPVQTALPLPLALAPRTRIAFIGNLLLDAERRYGHFETILQQRFPKH